MSNYTLCLSLSLELILIRTNPRILIHPLHVPPRESPGNGKAEATRDAMRARLLARYTIPSRGICFVAPHCFGQEIDTELRPGRSAARYLRYLPATERLSAAAGFPLETLTHLSARLLRVTRHASPEIFEKKTRAITRRDRYPHSCLFYVENLGESRFCGSKTDNKMVALA